MDSQPNTGLGAASSSSANNPYEEFGRKAGKMAGEAAKQIEEDAEKLIAYINNELVPQVREHSSVGLRAASKKLAQFADYLESTQKR